MNRTMKPRHWDVGTFDLPSLFVLKVRCLGRGGGGDSKEEELVCTDMAKLFVRKPETGSKRPAGLTGLPLPGES